MAMHHGRKLADHHAVGESTDEMMAGGRQIGHEACAIDRMIEHAVRDTLERHGVSHAKAPDLDGHSIVSSAVKSRFDGTSRPSALAAPRLTTSSNLVGCATGSSAGFSPLRMRAT